MQTMLCSQLKIWILVREDDENAAEHELSYAKSDWSCDSFSFLLKAASMPKTFHTKLLLMRGVSSDADWKVFIAW